ncbi:hypothetical protein D8674_021503 [Pyrus ussuriensis x Pyrus communis]|uniref:DUF4219 domain-containing protein n=1 Tax=Pyrus ussuriensis x Pyrus communis TaxID=2448454 RepID=A0A5N5GHB8_9ROSA|nr:hypothetical protein D8674_021503 [Pyrus ussuriensis x Pyrus communis]
MCIQSMQENRPSSSVVRQTDFVSFCYSYFFFFLFFFSHICRLNMAAIVIPTVLNHENYRKWSSRIKTYLLAEDLWDIAWKKKNVKALYAIQSSCGDVIYERIEYKTNAKEAWDALYDFLNPRYTPYISDTGDL